MQVIVCCNMRSVSHNSRLIIRYLIFLYCSPVRVNHVCSSTPPQAFKLIRASSFSLVSAFIQFSCSTPWLELTLIPSTVLWRFANRWTSLCRDFKYIKLSSYPSYFQQSSKVNGLMKLLDPTKTFLKKKKTKMLIVILTGHRDSYLYT